MTPPMLDTFDYRAFLAHRGIFSLMEGGRGELVARGYGSRLFHGLFALRQRAEHTVSQLLPEPHASLLSGILLGIESGIPEEVKEDFNATGATHVLVISGANFAILSAIFLLLGRRLLGEQRGLGLALAMIALYALLVGGDPPVLRAALMGALSVVALLLRRQTVALNTLAFAVWAMTAWQPGQLYDVGFQLSVLATLGLILLIAPLTSLAARVVPAQAPRWGALLRDVVLVSVAAQLVTTPLVVGTFGRLSLVSPLTNVLIAPVQGWLLASGGLAALAGMVWTPLGKALAVFPYAALTWTLGVVRWTATFPLASVTLGPVAPAAIWTVYAVAGVAWWRRGRIAAWWQSGGPRLPAVVTSRRGALMWGGVAPPAPPPWWVGRYLPDGRLHLYALDVGQGDALLIVSPDGKQVLVDGGPDPVALLGELGEQMPPWDRTLDLVVLSHADADHVGGLPETLARYGVAQVAESGFVGETPVYEAWQARVAEEGLAPTMATPGQRWQLGGGAVLEVLAPSGPAFEALNNNSVVLRLRYGAFCALLPGDIQAEAEARLVSSGALGACQVLKAPHHGSETSSTQPFLAALRPSYVIISAGAENRYVHPDAEVVGRYEAIGTRLLRTDEQGTIHLTTDGRRLWVETER